MAWTREENGPVEAQQWKIRDENGRLVCTLRSETRGDPNEEIGNRNSAIILASPQLLKVMEKVYAVANLRDSDPALYREIVEVINLAKEKAHA